MKKSALKNRIKSFLGKYKTTVFVVVLCLQLAIGLTIYFLFGRISPNDEIFVPKEGSVAFLINENPKFSVDFGKVQEPDKQWVRFEAQASSNNPFEEEEGNIFRKIWKFFQKKERYGIEMSLVGVDLEGQDLEKYGEEVIQVADIIGKESVKTSTELIDSGREIGVYEDKEVPVSKQTVLNKDVADGVDLEYQILKGLGLKEEIIIRDLEAYKDSCKEKNCSLPVNEFLFDLKMDGDVELKEGWFTVDGQSKSTYYFVDNKERYLAHFLPNFAIDGMGNETFDVNLKVEKGEGDNYRVKVTVNLDWLLSSERVFPVRIDPSIVHDDTTDFSGGIFNGIESVTGPKVQIPRDFNCYGGAESTYGGYKIHTFFSSDTFTCNGSGQVEVLVVAGGGGGGGANSTSTSGGGGGAGGLIYNSSYSVSAGSVSVTVGYGGAGGPNAAAGGDASYGSPGANSVFGTLTAVGGGGGGNGGAGYGQDGGSGGGAGRNSSHVGVGTSGQGTNGGSGATGGTTNVYGGGGGGGAGGAGSAGTTSVGGNGGVGLQYSLTGVATYFSGGGAGSRAGGSSGVGGLGGGGSAGTLARGVDGIPNTGGGGGGSSGNYVGGDGGSGIVIVRYPDYPLGGEYTSSSMDMGSRMSGATLSWTPSGVNTGDGETPYSTAGLVAQWNLNETSGTTAVSGGTCGASCNGTLTNFASTGSQDAAAGTGWTADNKRWGAGALMFDGTNDRVSVAHSASLNITSGISIETWINPFNYDSVGYTHILDKDSTYGFSLYYGKPSLYLNGAGNWWSPDVTALIKNQWYHLVATYDGSYKRIYLNGEVIAEAAQTGTITQTSNPIGLGSRQDGTLRMTGILDSTRLYSRGLSAAEVLSNYQAGNIEFQYRVSADNSTWSSWTSYGTSDSDLAWESFDTDEWLYEREITIDSSMVNGTSDLTDFPLFVSLLANNLKSVSNGGLVGQTDGGDFRFEDQNGNKLSHEIEKYSSTTGLLIAWVKIPTLAYDEDTVIKMKYGNASVEDQWNITGVWDSNYVGVWHMNQSSGTLLDSTSNGNDLDLAYGSPDYSQSGKIGDSINFANASSEYFSLSGDTLDNQPTGGTEFTTQTWFSSVATSSTNGFVMWGTCSSREVNAFRRNGDGYRHYFWGNDFDVANTISAATWYMAATTYNGNTRTIYHDGVSLGSHEPLAPGVSTGGFALGKTCGTEYWDGKLDEVRISKVARSADWIKTEYNNQNAIDSYLTFGLEKKFDPIIKAEGTSSMIFEQTNLEADNNTVGLWHLDERGGSGAYLKDSSVNASHGTPTGTTYTKAGKIGGARSFNGTSDYIDITSSISSIEGLNNGAISGWFKSTSTQGQSILLISDKDTGTDFVYFGINNATSSYSDESFYFAIRRDNTIALASYVRNGNGYYSDGQWHHFVVTVDSSGNSTYIDGKKCSPTYAVGGATTQELTNISNADTARIGSHIYNGTTTSYFNGSIDEVTVSNIARTEEEIASAYRLGRDTFTNKTVDVRDLSSSTTLSMYVAGDRPGSYLNTIWGETAFSNYQADANTVGLWHLDGNRYGDFYTDSSGQGNSGISSYYGIHYGIRSSNLTMIMNQFNGSANSYEMDITCTGGDAACKIITTEGDVISTPSIGSGVAGLDSAYEDAFIMYSRSLSGQGITPYTGASNNFIKVSYSSGWRYDNNSTWVSFTPRKDNILVASTVWGTSVTQIQQPVNRAGVIGSAMEFDGDRDIIDVLDDDTLDFTSSFSLDAWVYLDSLPSTAEGHSGIITKGALGDGATVDHNYWLSLCYEATWGGCTGDGFTFGFENSSGTNYYASLSNTALELKKWHHLAGVFDDTANTLKLYYNGVLVATTSSITATPNTQAVNLRIGGFDGVSGYLDGKIDEARVSNIARTPDEIRQAYEVGLRTHPIKIDFGASLVSGNLIANSGDTSFSIDSTVYGLADLGSELYAGEKVIVKENYDGTEYLAQGVVSSINESTGAVVVSSWDSGSTFPSGGYTVNADVFKWQKEYIPIKNRTVSSHVDAVNLLSFNIINGDERRNIWIDDLRSSLKYLSNYTGEALTFQSSGRYFQYKAIFSTWDKEITPYISQVQLVYGEGNGSPTMEQIMKHGKWFDSSGVKQPFWWSGGQ